MEHLIAAGGMGVVYEGWDRVMERRVALKVLDEDGDCGSTKAQRFQREVRVIGGIAHPNVVTVFDAGRDGKGFRFMAMELLAGPTLAARLAETPCPTIAFTTRVARGILEGLSAVHAQGIVHRDIKPDNVILMGTRDQPAIKLIDFGVAKVDDGSMGLTGGVVGTPLYLSPEQVQSAPVDLRSDLWAVGVVLYQMLTGHDPFVAGSILGILTAISTRAPIPPTELRPDIPPALAAFVMKALSRPVDDRFDSAAAMSEALAAVDLEPAAPARRWPWRVRALPAQQALIAS